MRHRIHNFSALSLVVFLIGSLLIMSCDEQELGDMALTGQSKTYSLNSASNSVPNGTVTLAERTDHSTRVTIQLDGATSNTIHPAHFYANSIIETGEIIIDLNPVDGTTGRSETVVFNKKNGNAISYTELLVLNAHISIASSETDFATLIAQADTGGNETTGLFKSYTLSPVIDSDLTGTVQFIERVNGTTLVVVDLMGASPIGSYRAFICENDVVADGKVVIALTSVAGGLGTSVTNVSQFYDGTTVSYDQLLNFDGHIKVVSNESTPKCMAQSNIGLNYSMPI